MFVTKVADLPLNSCSPTMCFEVLQNLYPAGWPERPHIIYCQPKSTCLVTGNLSVAHNLNFLRSVLGRSGINGDSFNIAMTTTANRWTLVGTSTHHPSLGVRTSGTLQKEGIRSPPAFYRVLTLYSAADRCGWQRELGFLERIA